MKHPNWKLACKLMDQENRLITATNRRQREMLMKLNLKHAALKGTLRKEREERQ